MRKLLSTATATCGVALALGMLTGATADASPAPGHSSPGHGHAGHGRPPGNHTGGHTGSGHTASGHHGGSHTGAGHAPGGHAPGGHAPGGHAPGGHAPGGQPGGNPPGGNKPGGGQPGDNKPGGAKPGGAGLARIASVNPGIVGGQQADTAPWAAQVSWGTVGFQCSGSVIAPDWVLTARHCVDDGDMTVRVGSTKLGDGTALAVDRKEVDSAGDLALLHLEHPVKTAVVKLADKDPKPKTVNEIYGWGGTGANSKPAADLRTAKVTVTGMNCKDAFAGRAICSTGVDGSAYFGDSGGPELADGAQVGVCSTGDADGKSQQYASVAAGRKWIKTTAGV